MESICDLLLWRWGKSRWSPCTWTFHILLYVHWLVFRIANNHQHLSLMPLCHHLHWDVARDKPPLLRAVLKGQCSFCLPLLDDPLWKKEAVQAPQDKELRLPTMANEEQPSQQARDAHGSLTLLNLQEEHQPTSCCVHRCCNVMVLIENRGEGRVSR